MIERDHFKLPPLSFATITLEDVRTLAELKTEAKGLDWKLRKESEGGCPKGFRTEEERKS